MDEKFDEIVLYSDYLQWESLVAKHLVDRCLHSLDMSKTSHDQSLSLHLMELIAGFMVTLCIVHVTSKIVHSR